jgi:hypothetical protein
VSREVDDESGPVCIPIDFRDVVCTRSLAGREVKLLKKPAGTTHSFFDLVCCAYLLVLAPCRPLAFLVAKVGISAYRASFATIFSTGNAQLGRVRIRRGGHGYRNWQARYHSLSKGDGLVMGASE